MTFNKQLITLFIKEEKEYHLVKAKLIEHQTTISHQFKL